MNRKVNAKVLGLCLMMFFVSGCSEGGAVETKKENPQALVEKVEKENLDSITPEEAEFNASGRAKAYDDETIKEMERQYADQEVAERQFFEDKDAGVSLNFPQNIALTQDTTKNNPNVMHLTMQVEKLSEIDRPGFDIDIARKNIAALEKGEFGEDLDQSLEASQKVKSLGKLNAQESLVLSRFEVCDVTFERKLVFYQNDYQITLTLNGPRINIINEMNNYFKMDEDNCGNEKIWDFNKQTNFYKKLQNNEGSPKAQEWFNLFDEIIETIELI